jgi:hypothetical protein
MKNKEEIFNQIKQDGCKCYWHSNTNNFNQDNLIKTIEKNKECIINGKIGNSFADVIKDKNNE